MALLFGQLMWCCSRPRVLKSLPSSDILIVCAWGWEWCQKEMVMVNIASAPEGDGDGKYIIGPRRWRDCPYLQIELNEPEGHCEPLLEQT